MDAYQELCTQLNIDYGLGPLVASMLGLDAETIGKVNIIWTAVTERKKNGPGDKPRDKGRRQR